MDNGPIARSGVFHQVMKYLGVEVRTHLPRGKDGRRVTARSKGKVERPFRTVKEMHETLYHVNEPETEAEANACLMQFLLRYNTMQHRSEPHSRFEDWLKNLPAAGIRAMCSWERYCTFAREAERRRVGVDARLSVEGTQYEVDPELAGETVMLWWGLFDNELYVEHQDKRYGPYRPVGGPIPLNRYRHFELMSKRRKTVALFCDEAHDLHGRTLLGLKRLMELVRASGSTFSVVLAGHPKLTNDLRCPSMEEIGSRATVFMLDGVKGHQHAYITWLLEQCADSQPLDELVSNDAIDLLVERLTTPLQIEYYLMRAFEEGYRIGQKPIGPEVIDTVLVKGLDDLEPRLTRHGYNIRALSELLNVRQREIRSFLQGRLPPSRTQELQHEMLAAGIPL
jgi:hypothetical protein